MTNKIPDIPLETIATCLDANEVGDATLYIACNQGRRLFNQTTSEWMVWQGHHWEIDRGACDAYSAVETVVECYRRLAIALVDEIAKETVKENKTRLIERQKNVYRRIDRLRSVRGQNNCLTCTTRTESRMVVNQSQLDQNPWALACPNGVVELRNGEIFPGDPKELLFKACPTSWPGISAHAPLWERTLLEIMAGDEEMVAFLQRLFGYAITGMTTEHIMPVLWGKGRNGKTLLVETIRFVLGPLAEPIRAEMLLDQSFIRSSSGPSPDLMALKGLRIAFASETDEGRRVSTSQVKMLTGSDAIVARSPHDKYETRFLPTHTLFLLTNNRPSAPADDFAFWKRLILIPFTVSFVENPINPDEQKIDKELPERLKQEAPGILAWLVRGCIEWQARGLDLPYPVMEATQEYQRGEDLVADFLEECCLMGDHYRSRASDLYSAFQDWFQKYYGKRVPTQKRFGSWMNKKFERRKDGVYYYYGVGLIHEPEGGY